MVKLRIGGTEYPLVLTVAAVADMEAKGVRMEDIPGWISSKDRTLYEAIDNGLDLLRLLLAGGRSSEQLLHGNEIPEPPNAEVLRFALTPGQIWGLCDAAIVDSIRRTVEAEHEKNVESVA